MRQCDGLILEDKELKMQLCWQQKKNEIYKVTSEIIAGS